MQNIDNKYSGKITAKIEIFDSTLFAKIENMPEKKTKKNNIYTTGIKRKILNRVKFIVTVAGSFL